MRRLLLKVLTVALMVCFITISQSASASYIAYDSTRNTGSQNYTGALGMDFDVNSPIRILELGVYDSDQNGLINQITVGIFDRNTQALVGFSAVLDNTDSYYIGKSLYEDIADFVLGVGSYSIVAVGFGLNDPNGNVNLGGTVSNLDTGGGLITFVGRGRYSPSTSFAYPTTLGANILNPVNPYDAGTFKFEAVPEPTTILLLGLGLVGLAGIRRFKR